MTLDAPDLPGSAPSDDPPEGPPEPVAGTAGAPDRMGWRSFGALAAGAIAVLLVLSFWPLGDSVDVYDWSRTIAEGGGGESLVLPPAPGTEVPAEELEERAGIRWVDIRIALLAGRMEEADSILRTLAAELDASGRTRNASGRVESLVSADLESNRRVVEDAQDALADALGPGFEEAVILESLRRAARTGLSDLATTLVNHPLLSDGVDEDLEPGVARRLQELSEAPSSTEELAEIEEIVSGILRRRAG